MIENNFMRKICATLKPLNTWKKMWAVTKILQKVVTSANQVLRKSLMSRNI
jgi:hypothetical protein